MTYTTAIFGRPVLPPKYDRQRAAPFQGHPNPMLALAQSEGHAPGVPKRDRHYPEAGQHKQRLSALTEQAIFELIRDNPGITNQGIREKTGLGKSTVPAGTLALLRANRIVSMGKAGTWVMWRAVE